jgi:uncharacterized phage protein (TIGR01671 family)
MREIKVRGYRETAKRWVYGVSIKGDGSFLPLNCYRMSKFFELVEECVLKYVTEYTGLLDKNGKEIYDGDILEYKDETGTKIKAVVEWEEAGWYCDGQFMEELKLDEYWKVIGNIYENKDLLK